MESGFCQNRGPERLGARRGAVGAWEAQSSACFVLCAGLVRPGDVLVCLTNKKRHPITGATSIEYIKKKIMGAPKTICKLTLQRDGVQFEAELRRGGFSQPTPEASLPIPAEDRTSTQCASARSSSSRQSAALLHTCGVGLLLGKDRQGNTVIEGIAPGGPADLSGEVLIGDIILG